MLHCLFKVLCCPKNSATLKAIRLHRITYRGKNNITEHYDTRRGFERTVSGNHFPWKRGMWFVEGYNRRIIQLM